MSVFENKPPNELAVLYIVEVEMLVVCGHDQGIMLFNVDHVGNETTATLDILLLLVVAAVVQLHRFLGLFKNREVVAAVEWKHLLREYLNVLQSLCWADLEVLQGFVCCEHLLVLDYEIGELLESNLFLAASTVEVLLVVDVNEELDESQYLARVALIVVALKHHLDEDADELADINPLLAVVLKVPANIHEVPRRKAADELVLQ